MYMVNLVANRTLDLREKNERTLDLVKNFKRTLDLRGEGVIPSIILDHHFYIYYSHITRNCIELSLFQFIS